MTTLFDVALFCAICGAPGAATTKPLNGLPVGVPACDECREAVKQRQVGVVKRESWELHITDGRLRKTA